ncbi:hypothetical protein ACWD9K_36985 [Streptomyces sp. 900116325]
MRVADGQQVATTASSRNSAFYQRFLQKLEEANPAGDIYVVTDNLSSHNSLSTRTWLEEYVHRHTFVTRAEARIKIATWITNFYNTRRLHSICGFKSPIDYEHEYRTGLVPGLAV